MSGIAGKVLALTAKDLRAERRGRDTLPPMLVFGVVVVTLLSFALPTEVRTVDAQAGTVLASDALAAFIWITVLFAGLIGFARTFEAEREDGALDSLVLAPVDRSGLFVAKALANLAFLAVVEVLVIAATFLFFGIDAGTLPVLLAVVVLADIGFVACGTLFASVAAQTRSRELVLPILALPALVPLFIAAFALTSDALAGRELFAVAGRGWFGILIAYDFIVGIASALVFDVALDS